MTNDIKRAQRRARSSYIGATLALSLLLGSAAAGSSSPGGDANAGATVSTGDHLDATLENGMRVVVVRNTLAPVVTVEMNFMVGAMKLRRLPGMAHAEEHMAFRGCAGMSADQTAAIYAELAAKITRTHSRTSLNTLPLCPRRIWTSR